VPARKKIASAPVKKRVAGEMNTAEAKTLFNKARTFHRSGRLENAKRLYQKTLKKDPGFADALNNLGVIYLHEKAYEKARINFEKAIRIRPEQVDPHYNLACVYALKGEKKQGAAHLKLAYSLDHEVKKWAQEDADLINLRGTPEYDEIVGK
jgi:tetratricopeptide (TPR) repeat protein